MEDWQDYVSQDDLYYHLEVCTQDGQTCECVRAIREGHQGEN